MEQENNFSFRQNTGRKNLLEIIKNFLRHNNKLVIVVIIILALTLPFIVNQVLKQQDLRQRASSFPPLTFTFDPPSNSLQVGYVKQFSLLLTTDVNDVGSIKVTVSYDPAIVKVKASSFGTALQAYSDSNDNGTYILTLLNPTNTKVTGSNLKVITFDVEGIKIGSTALSVKSIQATVSGSDQYAIINNPTNIQAPINVTSVQPTSNPGTPAVTGPITPSVPVPTSTYTSCTDSDGGSNYDIKGTINATRADGTGFTDTDFCYGGNPNPLYNVLIENKCDNTNPTNETFNCPNGCSDGACRPPANESLTPAPTSIPPLLTATPTPPVPTATLAPTSTPMPNDTSFGLTVHLPGIGNGSANLGLNSTPIHPQRQASIQILDNSNKAVKNINSSLTYSRETSNYSAMIYLGPDFATGSYSIRVKFENSLVKLIPGIFQITNGKQTYYNSAATLVTGDLNNDNTLGVIDWTLMIACIKDEAACTPDVRNIADLNDNGDVDEYDVQILQRGFAIRNGD